MFHTIKPDEPILIVRPCRIRFERITGEGFPRIHIEPLADEDGALKDAATILPMIAENDKLIDTARNFG